jgi:hypothetical protein
MMNTTTTTIGKGSKIPSLDIIGNKKERWEGHASSLSSISDLHFVVVVLHYLTIPTTMINKINVGVASRRRWGSGLQPHCQKLKPSP